MSDYLAIGGVTETLKSLLESQMEMTQAGGVEITSIPLDAEPTENMNFARINLLLYKIDENVYLKNQEIPGEGHPAAYGQPPLSLVLYYMVTAIPEISTGDYNADIEAHKMMADAMRVFHDYPILTDSMQVTVDSVTRPLLHSSLQNQFEKIKITLNPLDTEELSKLWLSSTKAYRLSVGYAVSVVQIESKKPRVSPKPVDKRRLHLVQLKRPVINDLQVSPPNEEMVVLPPATARIEDTLKLYGSNFKGVETEIIICDTAFVVEPESESLIEYTITDEPEIQPGPTAVSVRVKTSSDVIEGDYHSSGTPADGTNFVNSNQVALMIVPKITEIQPTSGDPAQILTITGSRLYHEGAEAYVMIGDTAFEIRKQYIDDLEAARVTLEAGIRSADPNEAFTKAKVALIDNRLFVVPGVDTDFFDFAVSGDDPAFTELGLNVGAPSPPISAELSSSLSNFNGLNSDSASINVTIGTEGPHEVLISDVQKPDADLDAARAALEEGIHEADSSDEFIYARVARVGDHLLILPGVESKSITFSMHDTDPAISELGLDNTTTFSYFKSGDLTEFSELTNDPAQVQIIRSGVDYRDVEIAFPAPTPEIVKIHLIALKNVPKDIYPVRVRVNGSESRDDKEFKLT